MLYYYRWLIRFCHKAELIFKIKQYISQIAKLTLAPAGDFTLHLSLEKLNNFFEELEGEVNE